MGLIEQMKLRMTKEKTEEDVIEKLDFFALEPYLDIPPETQLARDKERYLKEFGEQNKLEGKNTRALVVGRFQPPHAGHFYVIEAALQVADSVVIGIGSVNVTNEDNPFTAKYREEMLRYVLEKKGLMDRVRLVRLKDYGNNKIWGEKTLEKAEQWGKIDAVVGNSSWVNGIFQKRGYKTLEPPKLERGIYKSTLIRSKLRASGALARVGT